MYQLVSFMRDHSANSELREEESSEVGRVPFVLAISVLEVTIIAVPQAPVCIE